MAVAEGVPLYFAAPGRSFEHLLGCSWETEDAAPRETQPPGGSRRSRPAGGRIGEGERRRHALDNTRKRLDGADMSAKLHPLVKAY